MSGFLKKWKARRAALIEEFSSQVVPSKDKRTFTLEADRSVYSLNIGENGHSFKILKDDFERHSGCSSDHERLVLILVRTAAGSVVEAEQLHAEAALS